MEVAMSKLIALIVAIGCLIAPGAAAAHHGWSSYDVEKPITVNAPLTDVAWRNPHGTAKVVYRGKTWDVVLAPVARMEARGLTEAMLGPKSVVTLYGYPRQDGTAEMRIERISAGGKTIELR
jgi:hypothetical protein